jgi:hypothetical protein
MKNETKAAVEALSEKLDAFMASLAPLVKLAEHQAKVQAAQEVAQKTIADFKLIVDAIPEDVKKSLNVKGIEVDPPKKWFRIHREDAPSISVKKLDHAFRIRLRAEDGSLVKELNRPLNGLNAALKALA